MESAAYSQVFPGVLLRKGARAADRLQTVAGGILGYFVVGPWEQLFPYLLVIASSSFVYVAVADLIPQLQHRLPIKDTVDVIFRNNFVVGNNHVNFGAPGSTVAGIPAGTGILVMRKMINFEI